ncbi:ergothioneine biosynthesis protein EgtB [Alteromonas ponticola]|uniref:Ergothioneine biosynthesis protein EgtB n=1 Tax=Alteromonas ponticola TaxID=2720613 RepID=A0ABX1R3L2_9ALTE|nr:ergothioneine biosynthesis protein EgtB [Alteromonas ponticola]NMH61019.1 ergothioneine biosynthesis protein EgtB [Alteromonas ponticola]
MKDTVSFSELTAHQRLQRRYQRVRQMSLWLCKPLLIEDYGLQAAAEVSPPKWHLAHTTWFFETFLLKPHSPGYQAYHPEFERLFNSYYQGVGPQFQRPHRGLLSRPTLEQVESYRKRVDDAMMRLIETLHQPDILALIELGLHHEQQHQELMLTDIKFSFSANPLLPVYCDIPLTNAENANSALNWTAFKHATIRQGFSDDGFHFDNETPVHEVIVPPFKMANRLITNEEFLQFIDDGGYHDPLLWLSDGWQMKQQLDWSAPLYWQKHDEQWHEYTLHGLAPLLPASPVTHVSYYEAEAFARWAGKKLPTESQWEYAKTTTETEGDEQLLIEGEQPIFHPASAGSLTQLSQLFGSCWEWTQSAYLPYPGYQPMAGAVGEYNGKFMCNQMVLKGGSCATPADHIRSSYRNFFYPKDRWQFSGIRLVE